MSEFGKGYAYCIGLFLAHEGVHNRRGEEDKGGIYPSMWFNAASDHLFELQIPSRLPSDYRALVSGWRDACLGWRLSSSATWEDVDKSLEIAKKLLLHWDEMNGIECEKGDWE